MNHFTSKNVPVANQQRGIAMVEFVIVLPLLLLLMLATAEFGRVLFQYNTLTKSVRDGARYLSENAFIGSSQIVNTTAINDTRNLVVCGKKTCAAGEELLSGLTAGDVTPVATPGGEHISVTADYTYQPMIGSSLPTFGFGSGSISLSFTLTSSVTKRVL